MWMKIFSDPQNENPGEWGAPRPLHDLLRANWEPTRPISESCWWSGTRPTLKAPVQRRAVPGEGRASVQNFSGRGALGRDRLSRIESEKGARLGVRGPQECAILAQTTDFTLPCVLETILGNRFQSWSVLGWTKTLFHPMGSGRSMLSHSRCDALWCITSLRSRRGEEISGPIGVDSLPALLRRFWASHCSLPSDGEESLDSEHFRQKSTKSVRPSALVWTNLSCSRMRRSRAQYGCVARMCGQYAASYRPRSRLRRDRPACPPLVTHSRSVEAREWWSSLWCGEPAFHSPLHFERSGDDFGCECSTPRRFESGRGVETRDAYLGEIVLPVMGSGRRRYLNSSSSSRLQRLKCADMRLLLRCIGVSPAHALHHDGEGAQCSDFWALPSTPLQYASQQTVMWQPTLGMIIYAHVSIFHSTAKV